MMKGKVALCANTNKLLTLKSTLIGVENDLICANALSKTEVKVALLLYQKKIESKPKTT